MLPDILLETLKALPSEAPLIFRTEDGPIGAGYHVTEYKLAQVTGIDCGGRIANWTEAALQLLDGEGKDHMTVGKFGAILKQSISRVSGLGTAPLHAEFAHANRGKAIFQIETPEFTEGTVTIDLSEDRAHCKPALEAINLGTSAACCGSGSAEGSGSSCCQ